MRTLVALLVIALATPALAAEKSAKGDNWSMNATVIEACSCPMFCQCYFNAEPAGHGDMHGDMKGMEHGGSEHYCKFNNAYKVNKGSYNGTKLDGAKFWMYGDLGGDFSQGKMDWVVVTFDKSLSQAQRDGITAIAGKLFPVSWNSMKTAEGDIDWVLGKEESYATLDGGKTAEVRLSSATLNKNTKSSPIVIQNLKYWGAPRNDGFVMMPNIVEAVRTGDNPFEYKGSNGFLLTLDISSKDFASPSAPSKGSD
jgi:hypothetical protein